MAFLNDILNGGAANAAGSLSGGYNNSMGTYNQYLQQLHNMYGPYMQQGQQAGNNMMGMGNNMMGQYDMMAGNGPGGWMSQYQESPYAKYLTTLGNNSINNTAAASGMIGSGQNAQNLDQMNQSIASSDRQNYYNDMMGFAQGAQSNFNPMAQMGYGAASQLGQYTYGTGQNIGNAQQNIGMANGFQNMADAGGINNLISYL